MKYREQLFTRNRTNGITAKEARESGTVQNEGTEPTESGNSENFDETIPPLVILEHAALAAYFMTEKSWTFCPYTTAIRLQKNGACIYELKNSPPEQVVYYLVNENRKTATIHKFLELLTEKLKTLPKDKITSFLS